jgi:D-inositol-3-phosphate glycosyltransferase
MLADLENTAAVPARPRNGAAARPNGAAGRAAPVGTNTRAITVSLLTGGRDTYYAVPLAESLSQQPGVVLEVVGSDRYIGVPELVAQAVPIRKLHGDLDPAQPALGKGLRVARMYWDLVTYAVRSDSEVFHILWENKFKIFDRTILAAWYRLLGKRLVFTAHNVDADARDGKGRMRGTLGRLSLRLMYAMAHHVFVHTEAMKDGLVRLFGVPASRITVIPFGMNTLMRKTGLTMADARKRLSIAPSRKVVMFFGNITSYKGIEYLVDAFAAVRQTLGSDALLVIAGGVKNRDAVPYWAGIEAQIDARQLRDAVRIEQRFLRDDEVETFFTAADVSVLPYVTIDQSGVLILSYRYGVPVIATDVGSMRKDIVEQRTGLICRPRDAADLARALMEFFTGDLYQRGDFTRRDVEAFGEERHNWAPIAATIAREYVRSVSGENHGH